MLLLAVSGSFLVGCGDDGSTETGSTSESSTTVGESSSTGAASDLEGTVTVSGAKSLADAFDQIAGDFTAAHPGVEIVPTYDSSSTLAAQILEGAPADVFASADEATMTKLTDESLIAGEPVVFARNELILITKPGNPEGIASLADLADTGVISLCGEDVPCGKYAKAALDAASVTIAESSVTRGQNAAATLTAVSQGDAAAGIVYVTDALAAGDAVDSIELAAEVNPIATYPIGVLETSGNIDAAQAFVAYVLSDEGQATLAEFGFLPGT